MRQDMTHRPFPPGALEKRPRRARLQAGYGQSQQVTPRAPGASLQRGRGLLEWAWFTGVGGPAHAPRLGAGVPEM